MSEEGRGGCQRRAGWSVRGGQGGVSEEGRVGCQRREELVRRAVGFPPQPNPPDVLPF